MKLTLNRGTRVLAGALAEALNASIEWDAEHRLWLLLRNSPHRRRPGQLESVEFYSRNHPRGPLITWSIIASTTSTGASLNSSPLQPASEAILRRLVRIARRQK